MKLAHVAIVTPRKAGLYETTRELVAAERAIGADARIYDPAPTQFYPKTPEDRGALLADMQFVREQAEVIVDHSGCDGTTDKITKPHILVAHGRPKHSFLGEMHGQPPVYSYHYRIDHTAKYKAVVTFWPEHLPYLKVVFRKTPVYCVPAPVDLQTWTPDGAKHDFGGKGGRYNVVMTDAWRDDGDMFEVVNAVALAAKKIPLKLHIYAKSGADKGWGVLLKVLQEDGVLGEVKGWVDNLADIYRAADLLVTPHEIATRAKRESSACGCHSVVVGQDIEASAEEIVQSLYLKPREGTKCVSPIDSAKAFLAVAESAL